jgi:hypothetical protein
MPTREVSMNPSHEANLEMHNFHTLCCDQWFSGSSLQVTLTFGSGALSHMCCTFNLLVIYFLDQNKICVKNVV